MSSAVARLAAPVHPRATSLRRRRRAHAARARAAAASDADDDDDDDDATETTPSPSRSWRTLPVVHVLVFNPETPDEAIYTTSRRTADVARNDFLVFESLRDATRASVAISDTTPDGSMPVVDAVDPRVVAYMASTCGYGVECVAEGGDFTPPEVVVDETETVGGEGDEDDDDDDDDVLLAISTVDLARYLSDGGDLPAPDDDDAADEAAAEAAEKEKELRAARRRAARTMRKALRSPTSKVSALVRAAAAAPTKALLTPTRR